jgi:hypothetical protein
METPTPPPNPFVVDGALTMPSLEEWVFLPGDWAIYWLVKHAPSAADGLGVSAADYGGTFAALGGWSLCLLLAIALIVALSAVHRFNQAVTRGIVAAVADVRRRIRMAIVFARYRERLRSQRLEPSFDVEEPTLRLPRNMH